MKKFFSLVLALVMALSLTTVAWGAETVTDTAGITTAINNGATEIALTDGSYELNNSTPLAGKTLKFSGSKNAVITMDPNIDQGPMGSNLTFEGVTINFGTANYCGIKHADSVTYKNCDINGLQFLYADTVVFEGCKLNSNGAEHCVWTYGAQNVTFTGCNFTYGDRGINVYCDNDIPGGKQTVNFEDCTFTTSNTNSKGAVEINSSKFSAGADVSLNDCTAPANGEMAYVSQWDSTGGAKTDVFVDDALVGGVAEVGGTQYKSLTEAMNAVTSGATLTLLKDVTISDTWDCRSNGAKFAVPVTIDGKGHTLKFTGKVYDANWNTVFRFENTATVKNLTIDASAATDIQRGISSKGSIVVENCNLIGNGSGYGVIFGEGAGAANIGNVTATVTNSTFTNWAKGVSDNANAQDAKSVSITGSTFDNADVNVSAKETVTFTGNTVDDGSVIIHTYTANSDLAVTATGNTLDADEVNKIKAETITTDTNDFAATGALVAPAGYSVVNGKIVAKSSLTGNSTTLDVDDLTIITALGSDVPTTGITGITKYAASTSTTTVNGKTTTKVVPTWFLLSEGAYNYTFVECDKTSAHYMFTIKGVGSFYVREMDVPAAFDSTPVTLYTAPLKATCDYVGQDNDVYVVADGKYYAVDSAVKAGVEKYALLSNGKMVVFYGEATAKDHNWAKATKETYNTKTGDITSVKCPDCKNPVAVYKTAGVFDGKVYKQITVGVAKNYYYVADTAANTITGTIVGVPTTPSTDKVQSAETFDAGIAMYVGMSVMAAAGSAVVIGKKKD